MPEPSMYRRALEEFHAHPNALPATNGHEIRFALHREEHEELIEALELGDRAKIARELADVVYVCFGTALAHGIDLDAAFREIHRAAMDKMRAGLRREDGKILKPPGFVPPDMTAALSGGSSPEDAEERDRLCDECRYPVYGAHYPDCKVWLARSRSPVSEEAVERLAAAIAQQFGYPLAVEEEPYDRRYWMDCARAALRAAEEER